MISEGGKEGGWKGGGGGRKGLLVSVQKLKNIYVDSSDFIFLWYETDPTIQNSAFGRFYIIIIISMNAWM